MQLIPAGMCGKPHSKSIIRSARTNYDIAIESVTGGIRFSLEAHMKKFLFLLFLVAIGYHYVPHKFSLFSLSNAGAFDKSGKPLVVVFVGPNCGSPCSTIQNTLKERAVNYETIDVVGADGAPARNKYGINRYPTTLIGKRQILGDDTQTITSALAEAYGLEILPRMERAAMSNHFDDKGNPIVVMYGTSWCGYCKQQRAFFAAQGVRFEDIDVEASQASKLAYNVLKGDGYPLTYVGLRRFSGYKEQEILSAIAELRKR